MLPPIYETLPLSENRRLTLLRREGKRKTTVTVESPHHETEGIQFVDIRAHRICKNINDARAVFDEWKIKFN